MYKDNDNRIQRNNLRVNYIFKLNSNVDVLNLFQSIIASL